MLTTHSSTDCRPQARFNDASANVPIGRRVAGELLSLDVERNASALTCNPSTLAFRGSAPYAMIDVVCQRVFEAGFFNRAIDTDPASDVDSDAIAWKKGLWRQLAALAFCHPLRVHDFTHSLT